MSNEQDADLILWHLQYILRTPLELYRINRDHDNLDDPNLRLERLLGSSDLMKVLEKLVDYKVKDPPILLG